MMSFSPRGRAQSRRHFTRRSSAHFRLDAIHARPAYRAALAKGGPYSYAWSQEHSNLLLSQDVIQAVERQLSLVPLARL
jgi:hypothetical protein